MFNIKIIALSISKGEFHRNKAWGIYQTPAPSQRTKLEKPKSAASITIIDVRKPFGTAEG
jgi:hypothetical protein